jgi:hypothetical protein
MQEDGRKLEEEDNMRMPAQVEVVILVEEIVDIEECAKAGRHPHPHAKSYVIRVDKQKITIHQRWVMGREILEKAGKNPPDKYILRQVFNGNLEKIELDQVVDLGRPGIEKFKTMLRTAQDGMSETEASKLRRQFRLPGSDEVFLASLGLPWESIIEDGLHWLILRGFPLPTGYGRNTADIAINVAPGYPPGPLDMAFFSPSLSRTDGQRIPNTEATRAIDGESWQQWSRHRTPENPWVEGEDDLSSHIHYTQSWLAAEFERAA